MAGKISELTAATSVSDSDQFEVLQGGSNKRATKAMVNVLQSATVELTDAQIKTLPTTGIELLADVAAGKFPMIVSGFAKIINSAGAYTNVDLADSYLAIGYSKLGSVNNDSVYIKINGEMQFFTIADNKVNQFLPRTKSDADYNENYAPMFYPLATYDGTGLQVYAYNSLSNFTGGNAANSLKVTVYYVLIDL